MNYLRKIYCVLALININFLQAEILSWYDTSTLSEKEREGLQWLGQAKTNINWGYKNLSKEDKAVFEQGERYIEDEKALTRVMQNFVAGFCAHAASKNFPVKYDAELLSSAMVKMKKYSAVRMFVFSQRLTPQEKATVLPDNYAKSPEEAQKAMTKCGKLLAQELARIKVIPDEAQAQEQVAQEFTQKKMAELKEAYK